jgi:hypothetical protein
LASRAAKHPAAATKQLKKEKATTKPADYIPSTEESRQLKMQAALTLVTLLSLYKLGTIQAAPVSSGKH